MITILYGTIIDTSMILLAGLLGFALNKLVSKEIVSETLAIIALIALVAGVQMAVKSNNLSLVMLALIIGNTIGSKLELQRRINDVLGVEDIFKLDKSTGVGVFQAAIIATLFSLMGPMSIIGSISNGLNGDSSMLILKSGFDFITTLVLTASIGPGVIQLIPN